MSDNLKIFVENGDKRCHMSLLLSGDESELMIDRYLDKGELFVGMMDGKAVAVCVTLNVDDTIAEVKNLAVLPEYQHRGIGGRMLRHIEKYNSGKTIILGTGETPSTLRFYKKCGYKYSHRITGFFTDNYPNPIIEEGVVLSDMIYLKKETT